MKFKSMIWVLALVGFSPLAPAVEETFCTEAGKCVPDILRLVFDDTGTSQIEVSVDQEFTAGVVMDVKSQELQGWTYGVGIDPQYIEVVSVDIKNIIENVVLVEDQGGTDVRTPTTYDDLGENIGFKINNKSDPNTPGFIQAIILAPLGSPLRLELPLVDGYRIANVTFKCIAAPPEGVGTKLFFTSDRLPNGGAAPTAVNLTVSSASKQPETVDNGIVLPKVGPKCPDLAHKFYFGPAGTGSEDFGNFNINGAGTVSIALRNAEEGLGFSMGVVKSDANLTFDNDLLKPKVDDALTFTKYEASNPEDVEITGTVLIGNSATGAPDNTIAEVTRGAAIAANEGEDFWGLKIATDGLSFTIGYATDVTGNGGTLPPIVDDSETDPDNPVCNSSEILVVNFGEVPEQFVRGDATGDGKYNITDGVVIAQNIFAARLIFFDCPDMLDVNDDGVLNTADPVHLLRYVFLDGQAVAEPFGVCGEDPTGGDSLGCPDTNCQ